MANDTTADAKKKAPDPTPEVLTASDRANQTQDEYGKYVATARILAPSGAGAFNIGDPIPTSTIERDDLKAGVGLTAHWLTADSDGVALRDSDEGRAAVRAAGGEE